MTITRGERRTRGLLVAFIAAVGLLASAVFVILFASPPKVEHSTQPAEDLAGASTSPSLAPLISSIRFEGAVAIPEAELRASIGTTIGERYSKQRADYDALLLTSIYFDRGMIKTTAKAEPSRAADGGADSVELVFRISEGEVFLVGRILLTGLELGPEQEVLAALELVAWLAVVAAGARRAAAARAVYLLVSPLGMPARGWLEAQLQARGPPITSRTRLGCWARISTAVQVRQHDPAHLRRAVLYDAAWRARFPRAAAEAWGFEPAVHGRLVAAKRALRAGVAGLAVRLGPRAEDRGVLHGFHLADPGDEADEARRLEAALRAG